MENYLAGGGTKIVNIFAEHLCKNITRRYIETIKKLRSVYCPDSSIINGSARQLCDLSRDMAENGPHLPHIPSCTQESALEYLYEEIDSGEHLPEKTIFSSFPGVLTILRHTFPRTSPISLCPIILHIILTYSIHFQESPAYGFPLFQRKKAIVKDFFTMRIFAEHSMSSENSITFPPMNYALFSMILLPTM